MSPIVYSQAAGVNSSLLLTTASSGEWTLKPIVRLSLFPAVLLILGCGADNSNLPPTVLARGVVTLDGKPVEGAQVILIPDPPGTTGAYATTNSGGTFSLHAFEQKDGALPGSYKVQVSKTMQFEGDGPPNPDGGKSVRLEFGVPAKYTGIATSGLSLKIPDAGISDIKFELTSK